LIDRQETILGRYHKRTLLPLGEYVPGKDWFPWLARLLLIEDSIAPGTSSAIMDLGDRARIGALICYEDMLEGNARASVRAGAELLVVLANGSAFDNTPALGQHQQLAFFRAIENRRYLLRCSTTGTTAVISPTGKVVAQLPPQQDGTLPVTVYPYNGRTVFTRIGNLAGYFCLAAMGILILQRWHYARVTRGW
jgi:apolipoprotein N-acyltransferase